MLHTAITFLSACKTKKKSANKDGVEHGSRIKIVMLHVVMPRFANFSLQERYYVLRLLQKVNGFVRRFKILLIRGARSILFLSSWKESHMQRIKRMNVSLLL